MIHHPQVCQNPLSLTQSNNKGYIQHSSMAAGQYSDQASEFNWLDAISGDNGNLDPRYVSAHMFLPIYTNNLERTYQVHQTATHNHNDGLFSTNPFYYPDIRRPPLIRQPPYTRRNRLDNWVRVNQFIADTTGFEPPEENWEESSCNSSTAETLVEELQIPISLEAEPPFPRPNPNESSLFGPHNQISSEKESNQYLAPTQSDSDFSSCENALLPFCQPLPAPSSSSSSSGTSEPQSCEPQWLIPLLGRLFSKEARKACRKLRRKSSHNKTAENYH